MGCSSCGTSGGSCSSGGCGKKGGCSSGACNKLNVFDWLSDIQMPAGYKPFNIVEIRFKGSRKEFYRNEDYLELYTGDPVVVQSDNGFDIGHVSLSGELVRLQLKRYNIDPDSEQIFKIYRKANEKDLQKYQELKDKEAYTLERARTVALNLGLVMKLSDIEFQGDGRKVVFFYTAEERVDFRELIKLYAEEFKVRIEMKQIGYRQEASRLGGIGSCGRELCCSTWLTEYKVVNTSAARYQNLSINMLKLSGQCGRLKCCLNFELDNYMDVLQEFPKSENVVLETKSGNAKSQKVDILKKLMWFAYEDGGEWIPLPISKVNEIIEMNARGEKPEALSEEEQDEYEVMKKTIEADDIISDNSLDRLEQRERKKSGKKKTAKKAPSNNRREGRDFRENREVRDNRETREPRENKEVREQRENRDNNPNRENREPRNNNSADRRPNRPNMNQNRRNGDQNRRPPRNNEPRNPNKPDGKDEK